MSGGEPRFLIFAEDPGAANFVAELPAALAVRSLSTSFFSAGLASAYLTRRGIQTSAMDNADVERVLDELRPAGIVVGTAENPDTAGLALIDAARSRGVVTVGAIDAPANAALRFRGRDQESLAHAPDWLLVPEDGTARAFAALGFPSPRIVACGHPHFDWVRAYASNAGVSDRSELRGTLVPRATPEQKVVIFAAEPSTGLDPSEYRQSSAYQLEGRGQSRDRTEIVLEEFLDALTGTDPRPYIVLRLHPKNRASEFDAYLSEIDQVSQDEPALDLILAADALVGMTTMLLTEAVLLGRPTLAILPRAVERDWLPTIELGLTPCAHTRDEIEVQLGALLSGNVTPLASDVARALPSGGTAQAADLLANLVRAA